MCHASPSSEPSAAELSFRFLSGRLCLAFCATVGERWRHEYERLRSPEDLQRWFTEGGLVASPPPVTHADLRGARELREAIYRAAKALIDKRLPAEADEAIINRAAAAAPVVPSLQRGRLTRSTTSSRAALSTIARDAIELFDEQPGRIRECASPECGLLFFDASRPGHRRWCSSGACGGRDRAARFRRRHAASDTQPHARHP
jgi:predicted RNA-binding Zn ribbon-like protein